MFVLENGEKHLFRFVTCLLTVTFQQYTVSKWQHSSGDLQGSVTLAHKKQQLTTTQLVYKMTVLTARQTVVAYHMNSPQLASKLARFRCAAPKRARKRVDGYRAVSDM